MLLTHNERQEKVVGCVEWAGRGQQGLKTLPKNSQFFIFTLSVFWDKHKRGLPDKRLQVIITNTVGEGNSPCPQVSRARRPVIHRQDVKVLLQRKALEHQLYPVMLCCHDHPCTVGIVRITVGVAGALYCRIGNV